jgi:hypothetical protein
MSGKGGSGDKGMRHEGMAKVGKGKDSVRIYKASKHDMR